MQITVNIPDEIVAQAQARGLSPERYVEGLVELRTVSVRTPNSPKLSAEELESALDAMARHSDKIPDLPMEAFSRESIYQDHD